MTTHSMGQLEHESLHELRSQFRAEQLASWIAAMGVAILAVVYRQPWGMVLGAAVAAMAVVRLPAFAAIERHDVQAATWWNAIGTWGIAVVVAGVVPDALPIMVLNLIGPLFTAAMYLPAVPLRRMMVGGVGVAVVLGVLGFRSEGTGIEDAIPEWVFQMIMVVYLASHVVVLSISVGATNRLRHGALAEATEANRALTRADAELRESRRRAIAAGDAERIRVERNIHDGAQQRLVAIAVQLQLAAQAAKQGTGPTGRQLEQLHHESREAIDELRELARGIYPSVLSERGLPDALRSAAHRSPVTVTVDVDDDLELSRDDAAAVYFICLEALQNVAKHAPDASVQLSCRRVDHPDGPGVVVEVVDDGPGFDTSGATQSRGLLNMADRAGALGGTLSIESTAGRGTRVAVRVPESVRANVS